MTAALTIITDALAEIGVVGAADVPSAEDTAFCLRKLNQAMQRISNSPLMFPRLDVVSITMTGAASYTVGPSGGTVAAAPIKVDHATATDSTGYEYQVDVLTREEWDDIGLKNVTGGPPSCILVDSTATNVTVYVYPKTSGYTLKLHCQTLLASFADNSTQLTLPEGYETLLTLMVADDIATAYGRPTPPDTRRRLAVALNAVRMTNAEPVYLETGLTGEAFDIRRGY